MTAITIRRATPADAGAVATMVGEIATLEDQAAHVHADEGQWGRLLARQDDRYVRPGHRDAGVGRRLMAALAALAAPDQLLVR